MAYICSVCNKNFSRMDNLKRHENIHNLHKIYNIQPPHPPMTVSVPQERRVILQHPFSMLLVGPTGSGKTSLLKKILENNMIEPAPHYIIWYYKI